MNHPTTPKRTAWRLAYWLLLAVFLSAAALDMAHIRAGFLTNYAADLAIPAWLYIASRGLADTRHSQTLISRSIGSSPTVAALTIFLASALTELSQIPWPHGLFKGTFDPWDLCAYGFGVSVCYLAELIQARLQLATASQVAREPS